MLRNIRNKTVIYIISNCTPVQTQKNQQQTKYFSHKISLSTSSSNIKKVKSYQLTDFFFTQIQFPFNMFYMKFFSIEDPDIVQRLVSDNEHAFCFLNKMPILPGHTLICPKKPISSSKELTPEIWADLLKLKEIVCHKLEKLLHAQGFNFAWNEGSIAGQTVPHFHLHVVPRKENDSGIAQYEPRVFLYRPGSRADSPKEELMSLSKVLREI